MIKQLIDTTVSPVGEIEETKVWRMGWSITGERDWISGYEMAFESESLALLFYVATGDRDTGELNLKDEGGPIEMTMSDAMQWARSNKCKELWLFSDPGKWQEYPV